MAYKIKFNDDLNLKGTEMHILRDLDKVHFFENAEYVIVERPCKAFTENFPIKNGIAFWMAEKDAFESYKNVERKSRYVIIEFKQDEQCEAVYLGIPISGGSQLFTNFKYSLNDMEKCGFKVKNENDYETIGRFINKMLYEHFFYDFGEKETMFAGWDCEPDAVEA